MLPCLGYLYRRRIRKRTSQSVFRLISVVVNLFLSLKAKVSNNSEYTLLPGIASVYVDGSFISRSDVPAVSPQESFTCPLGYVVRFLLGPYILELLSLLVWILQYASRIIPARRMYPSPGYIPRHLHTSSCSASLYLTPKPWQSTDSGS